jgi:hypothetical protein
VQMLVGERKQVSAALLDPAGRRSPTSEFWSSRECRYFVRAAVCVGPGVVLVSAITGLSQASIPEASLLGGCTSLGSRLECPRTFL